MDIIGKLIDEKLITPPKWMKDNIQFATIFGSVAYGMSTDLSDMDIYAYCIPPKTYLFPHLAGYIDGFGTNPPHFDEFQQHHISYNDRSYDVKVFNIVKFFELARLGNPNCVEILFTTQNCILKQTVVGQLIRENRKLFLSKKCWPRFKGYAYSNIKFINDYKPQGKRMETIQKYGWDVKAGAHLLRLINEIEQILMYGDLDLTANADQLRQIRNGKFTANEVMDIFNEKEKSLEKLYLESTLQNEANEEEIKQLLLKCLEMHYGSLNDAIIKQEKSIADIYKELGESLERKGIL